MSFLGSIVAGFVTLRAAKIQVGASEKTANATIESGRENARGVIESAKESKESTIQVNAQDRFAEWQQHKRSLYGDALEAIHEYRTTEPALRVGEIDRATQRALLAAQLVANTYLRVKISLFTENLAPMADDNSALFALIEDMNKDARGDGGNE